MLHYTTIYSHLNKIKIPKIISEINGFGLLDNKTYCKIRVGTVLFFITELN